MKRVRFVSWAVLFATGLLSAQVTGAPARPTKLDPNVLRTVRTGLTGPGAPRRTGTATSLVELDRTADAQAVKDLERRGVHVVRVQGKPLTYGNFVVADVDEVSARTLA